MSGESGVNGIQLGASIVAGKLKLWWLGACCEAAWTCAEAMERLLVIGCDRSAQGRQFVTCDSLGASWGASKHFCELLRG